jgi:hypothetical protein
MLSSWRMYEMHPALSFKTGCYTTRPHASAPTAVVRPSGHRRRPPTRRPLPATVAAASPICHASPPPAAPRVAVPGLPRPTAAADCSAARPSFATVVCCAARRCRLPTPSAVATPPSSTTVVHRRRPPPSSTQGEVYYIY